MTMNGFDIDELERMLAAATPGEWIACGWGDGSTPDGVTNIFNHDAEVLLMECMPVDDAALIVALHNSAPAMITEIRELRAENARLKKLTSPTWFYHPEYPEYCRFAPTEVIDEDYDPEPGDYVLEIDCAVALPSIWCAVHVSGDPDDDERFTYTEHASEAEARAALGEPQ